MLVGIVGKANVGKSTFFKALTLAEVEIANYPFTTIKPNHGIGFVKVDCIDKEFNLSCKPKEGYCVDNKRFIPVDLLDVAGLVPGAHEGKGMGNQFLDDLRQADALIHVVDISGSTNERGEPVEVGSYDPLYDIAFLEHELDMWYLQIFEKVWTKFSREVRQEHRDIVKSIAKQFSGLNANEELIKEIIKRNKLDEYDISSWTDNDLKTFVKELRKITKPIIIAANKIDVKGAEENLEIVKKKLPEQLIVPCSAESELALKEATKHHLIKYVPGESNFEIISNDLNERQKNALNFIKTHILDKYKSTGVEDVLDKAVFELLKYIAVFPVTNNKLQDKNGNVLPDCFLVPENTTALEFAYKVHTEIGDNFVKAINLKTKLPIAKNQPLKNRDVVEIMTSK